MGGGVWYSLFIKNLAQYSSHKNFGLFIRIRPITVNLVLVRTVKNNYFSLCTN